ncbi:MAG: hypothetical protein K6B65_03085 [Bacilli bacterium]|nr:hypothetical protein [Bacilli bacterium]
MGLKKRYIGLSDEGKTLFWLILVDLVVFLGMVPFFFLSFIGLPLGWLLGSAIEIVCFLTMIKGSGFILDIANEKNGRNRGRAWALVFAFLRFVLMVGGLVLSAVFTFKMEGNYLNFFACAAGYLPLMIVAIVFNLLHKRKKDEKPVIKEELEEGEEPLDA